jgi:hypothetical protein
MDYCGERGIPHSTFLGSRRPGVWTDDDQDKAIAWQRHKKAICPGCGTRAEEWSDDRHAFVGDQVRCLGCEVLEQERENVPEGAKGVHVRLVTHAHGIELARGEG